MKGMYNLMTGKVDPTILIIMTVVFLLLCFLSVYLENK